MSNISKEEYLSSLSGKLNIELSKEQLDSFLKYYELLIDWNEKINLTAIIKRDRFSSNFLLINKIHI